MRHKRQTCKETEKRLKLIWRAANWFESKNETNKSTVLRQMYRAELDAYREWRDSERYTAI